MKIKPITIFLLIVSFCCNAQDLTFKDLEYVLKNNSDIVSTYLSNKGFEFFKYQEASIENRCSSTHWANKRNLQNNFAEAFIAKYCELPMNGFVWYQPPNAKINTLIKLECKKSGFIFKERIFQKEVDAMVYMYDNDKYHIEFAEGIDNNNKNVYSITLKPLRK